MAIGKQERLDIVVGGVLDPSLQATIRRAEDGMRALNASARTISQAMKPVYAAAFPADNIQKSIDKVSTFHSRLADIGSMAAGIGLGQILVQGMDMAIAKVGEFVGALKGASDAAANLEIQRSNLQAATQLSDKQMQDLQSYFWQKSVQVPVTVPTQMAGFKRIEEAITESDPSKRISLGKEEANKLLDIAALAINPAQGNIVEQINEQYKNVVDVVTKMRMYGVLNQRILSEFEGMGLNLRPGMMAAKGLISQEQLSHWSTMDETERDKLLGDFAKDVKKRTIMASLLDEQITALTAPGGKAFGRAAAIAGTTGGVESSTADVMNFFATQIGQVINGPLKQLFGAINSGFAAQIPQLTVTFGTMAAAANEGFKPILTILQQADWHKIGADVNTMLDEFGKAMKKDQPFFEWMAHQVPLFIDDMIRLATAIEKVAGAIGKAFKWANNLFPESSDAVKAAQEQAKRYGTYNEPVLQSAEAIQAYKDHQRAIEKTTDAVQGMDEALHKTTGNDFVHFNWALDAATQKLLRLAGTGYGGNYGLHGGLADQPGETFYEHPDTEGYSSQYGPTGNALGYNYGVGLGPADRVGHKLGSWVKIRTPNGRVLWRQVNEHATRGIEFVTPSQDESSYGSGRSQIIDSSPTKPDGASIHIHYNPIVSALDSGGVSEVLRNHIDAIAEAIHRHTQSLWERSAVV